MANLSIIEGPTGKALVVHGLTEDEYAVEQDFIEQYQVFARDLGLDSGVVTTLTFENALEAEAVQTRARVQPDHDDQLQSEYAKLELELAEAEEAHADSMELDHRTIEALRAENDRLKDAANQTGKTDPVLTDVEDLQARWKENSTLRNLQDVLREVRLQKARQAENLERYRKDALDREAENQGFRFSNAIESDEARRNRLNETWNERCLSENGESKNWSIEDWKHVAKHFAEQVEPDRTDKSTVAEWSRWVKADVEPKGWRVADWRIVTNGLRAAATS